MYHFYQIFNNSDKTLSSKNRYSLFFISYLTQLIYSRSKLDATLNDAKNDASSDAADAITLMLSRCQFRVLLSDLQRAHKTMSNLGFEKVEKVGKDQEDHP